MSPKKLLQLSLQFKVAAVLLLVLVCSSAIAALFSMRWMSRWLSAGSRAEAVAVTETIATAASEALRLGDREALRQAAERALHYDDVVAVSILNADGSPLAAASSERVRAALLPIEPESISLAYERQLGHRRLLVARPVLAGGTTDPGRLNGAIRLAFDTSDAEALLRKASAMTWSLSALVVLGMFPLAILMLQRVIIHPVHRLALATGRLGEGDYGARAETSAGGDDIAVLAESFNRMAACIEAQHDQLIASNEDLEGKVQRRTAELDLANHRLRQQMTEHREFLRAVSHDLNAPLRNIAGIADLMLLKWADQLPEDVLQRLKRIKANADRESELINDLLEISRLGAAPVRPQAVDLGELLAELRGNFEYDLRRKAMRIEIAERWPTLTLDPHHARKLFQNLIDNAVKYMPAERRDGLVEIRWQRDETHYVFEVADNGSGIDPRDRDKVFTVFRRGSDTSNEPGKGVGLAGVSAIATRYDGAVDFDSEPGVGTVFRVRMSRAMLEAAPDGETPDPKVNNHAGQHDRECVPGGVGR